MSRTAPVGVIARRVLFALAVLMQLAVIYAPQAPGTPSGWPIDKVVHASVFALVLWTGAGAGVPLVPLTLALAIHAPLSEYLQSALLPDRSGDPADAVADLVGTFGAYLAWRAPFRASRKPPDGTSRS